MGIASCTINNKTSPKEEDQLALYLCIDKELINDSLNLILFLNDTILYNGTFIGGYKTTIPSDMFISNIKKENNAKFRFVYYERDTTFFINTLNIDSLVMSFYGTNGLVTIDNHDEAGWIIY